jgi:hypothetical protein
MAKIAVMKSPPLRAGGDAAICARPIAVAKTWDSHILLGCASSGAAEKLSVYVAHQGESAFHHADGAVA